MKDAEKLGALGLIVFIFGVVWLFVTGTRGDMYGAFLLGLGFGVLASTASVHRLEKKISKIPLAS